MYTILSKSEGVPFQISFFLGDLTWNDPNVKHDLKYCLEHVKPEPLNIKRQSLVLCLHELSLAKCSQLIVNGFISEEIGDIITFICSK